MQMYMYVHQYTSQCKITLCTLQYSCDVGIMVIGDDGEEAVAMGTC